MLECGISKLSNLSTDRHPRGGVRSNGVESIILLNKGGTAVDVSDFFSRYCFPKLQHLELSKCRITSWDRLTSRTAVLTTLILRLGDPSPTPTTSKLLSILASNPTLRKIVLSTHAIPNDGGGNSSFRVPLHHLEKLELAGGLRHVVELLHQLDHPSNMDRLDINLLDCTIADVSQIVGPYLRDYLRRRDKSQNGLGLSVSQAERGIILHAGDTGGIGPSNPVWKHMVPFVSIKMGLNHT